MGMDDYKFEQDVENAKKSGKGSKAEGKNNLAGEPTEQSLIPDPEAIKTRFRGAVDNPRLERDGK